MKPAPTGRGYNLDSCKKSTDDVRGMFGMPSSTQTDKGVEPAPTLVTF